MRDTIDMAREAGGIRYTEKDDNGTGMFATFDMVKFGIPMLERFEALVRADEREACAKMVEELNEIGHSYGLENRIRARGNT